MYGVVVHTRIPSASAWRVRAPDHLGELFVGVAERFDR
jgi:hypothetical protein